MPLPISSMKCPKCNEDIITMHNHNCSEGGYDITSLNHPLRERFNKWIKSKGWFNGRKLAEDKYLDDRVQYAWEAWTQSAYEAWEEYIKELKRMIKRSNFTNEEFKQFLKGHKVVRGNGTPINCDWNAVIDDLLDEFYTLTEKPESEFGALAYDTETKQIVHIGKIPQEMMDNFVKNNIDQLTKKSNE